MSQLVEALKWFECVASDDEVKTDLELTCGRCGKHLCDVEAGDTIGVLASVALDHKCKAKAVLS